jgi:spermidine/putrescine transport system permease protein
MAVGINFSGSASHTTREKTRGRVLALPAVLWLGLFFILPLLIVLVISFLTRGTAGVLYTQPVTLANYATILNPQLPYFVVFQDSIVIAGIVTVICLLVGYPLAFFIATRQSALMKNLTLFLVILPFWTNFLVRTYAIKVLIGQDGPINTTLLNLGLITEPLSLVNTQFAVLLGLVYTYLPFMVLPIYSSVERFEFRLVEAANDLGANDLRSFWRVVLPLTLPGVMAGSILVFIPTIGAFITPDLLGGVSGLMIGNLINTQFRGSGNWPRGAAASMVMLLLVMISLIVYVVVTARSSGGGRRVPETTTDGTVEMPRLQSVTTQDIARVTSAEKDR